MFHDLSDQAGVLERMDVVARRAVAAYGWGEAEVSLLNVSENATFKVVGEHGAAALRVHRLGYHAPGAIDSELAWLEALRSEAGVLTPRILRTPAGERTVTVPDPAGPPRVCVLFEFLPGAEPVGDFEQLGAITARMHEHARAWRRPTGFTRFAWDVEAAFGAERRWGDWRHAIGLDAEGRELLARTVAEVGEALSALGTGSDRWGLIHGDLRQANLLEDAGSLAVIDFDDCGFGWFTYDLAGSLSFIEHTPEVPALIDSWLRGYRTVADPGQLDLIPTFVIYRRLLLTAWIASHQAAGIAAELGASYTEGTCSLAEAYLAGTGSMVPDQLVGSAVRRR